MSLFVASLNSGSNGNCYYVGNRREAVLIDAGISCRETEIRMKRIGLSMQKVKALFVSHEHSDHVAGVSRLSKKYQLPVYVTPETMKEARLTLKDGLARPFKAYEPIAIDGLSVTAFPKLHDACDPHSFLVTSNRVTVGVLTDIGFACDDVIKNFQQCHAVFLEANYDESMLEKGRYPLSLKNRIRNGQGHLSNRQAFDLVMRHRPPFMSHLLLSHLSEENNRHKIVKEMFQRISGNIKITVASRAKETKVHVIHPFNTNDPAQASPGQLSFF
jgi:phosphoribosyl 1,2-cyclic phosphodiesterase